MCEKEFFAIRQSLEKALQSIEKQSAENMFMSQEFIRTSGDKINGVIKDTEGFKEQIHKDFSILTGWAGQIEKKVTGIPYELTSYVDKSIRDFEAFLYRNQKDSRDSLNRLSSFL